MSQAQEESRNSRYGLILFALYCIVYGGFIYFNAFHPERMAAPSLLGLNLAIVYGLGLIAGAVVLALIYMALCRAPIAADLKNEGGSR